jgi:hypothetical protein
LNSSTAKRPGRRGVQIATHELDKLARTAGVKDVVASRYQLAFVPFNECVAASREGRRHAVIPEAPYPLLGRVEGVSAVEHRPEVTCELLRHATALRLRQRVERISHQKQAGWRRGGSVPERRAGWTEPRDGQGVRPYAIDQRSCPAPHTRGRARCRCVYGVVARKPVEPVQAGQ